MKRVSSLLLMLIACLALLAAQPTPAPSAAPAASAIKPAISKDETVFAVLDANGAVKSVIVSDWLHSDKPGIEVKDRSNLTNIENVKGYEQPRRVGDALLWKLDGSDLYYRGKSTRPLPLTITIRYWLDGKPIEPAKLAGKSGLVRVRVEVKNLATAERIIDGTKKKIYAPMIVVVGLTMPVIGYRDLQVTGGTVLTDGQNNIAAGLLVPGLRESIVAAGGFGSTGIDLSSIGIKDMPLPDAFEFSTRADHFKLGSIFIAATPDFPELGGPNTVKALDDALAGFQQLADSSTAIKQGSAALAAGASTLRASLSQAITAIRPALSDNKATINKLSAFISNDSNIAAARELLSASQGMTSAGSPFVDLVNMAADPKNQTYIQNAISAAKLLNVKDLIGAPSLSKLVSEDSLASMAEAITASDSLYRGMDEKRLQAAADFAGGAAPLFDALGNFDATALAYDPAAASALQAFGAKSASYAALDARLASFDANAAATGLSDRAKADASFVSATAFLDSPAAAALSAKLASGASLSADERTALASLISASSAERAAAKSSQVAQVASALPALGDAARLAQAARPAAAAAAAMSDKVFPGLAAAQAARSRTETSIQAGKKVLDPKTVAVVTGTVPKIFQAKKAYDKNRTAFQTAQSFLALRSKNGGFKAQIGYVDSLQTNLNSLGPLLLKVQDALASPVISNFTSNNSPNSSAPGIQSLMADIQQLSPLLDMGQDMLSQDNVQKLRGFVAYLPQLDSGLEQLDNGSALLAQKMGELAAGTKQFDEQGIQKIASEIVDKAHLLRGFLKVKDELTALSRDYQSFSGAPDGADTTLKFIFKTDEIK